MSIDSLNIKRNEYISILRNRGKSVSPRISDENLHNKVKYLRKRDLRHLANFRNVHINDNNIADDIINALQNRVNFLNSILQQPQKLRQKKMLSAIRGYPYKKQQQAITKSLKDLRLHKIAERKNITQKDLEEITRLKHLSLDTLKRNAQLRDVSVKGLKKENIIYILLRSLKNLKETK